MREAVGPLIFRPVLLRLTPFEMFRERTLSYLLIVPAEAGQKDVMDV